MVYVYRLLLVAFTFTLVGCQHGVATGRMSQAVTGTPEALTRQFVDAMDTGDRGAVHHLFISYDELASLFESADFNGTYDAMEERFNASLGGLHSKMQGAQFVRMDMSFAGDPILIGQGEEFGPLTLRADTLILDNVHAVLLIDGVEKDLKLDEMIRVNGSWRLLDTVELRD
ncbi:MAG: hypothetical protein VCD00_13790 [Candidatus Hydrogenedentota bacterium]